MIDLEFDNLKVSEDFLTSMREVWRSAAAVAALTGNPQTRIVEVVESKKY
jgi:hypothetical protein